MFSSEYLPLWSAVAALAAAISALFAALYTFLTYRLVQIHDQAKVVVYVRHDFERRSILCIRVENIGRDIARDVKFSPSREIPSRAFGIEEASAKEALPMKDGPLVEGIPALGPGDFREITWGQLGGISKALAGRPIILNFEYSSGKRTLRGSTALEVRSYWETDASERPSAKNAKSLESIADSLGRLQQSVAAIQRAQSHSE